MPSPSFNHRQTLRRWARRVLLLWLFAVGAAFANACLASQLPAAAMARADLAAASTESQADGGQTTDCHGLDADEAKNGCLAFCERTSASAVPLKPAIGDLPGPDLAAPLPAPAWQPPVRRALQPTLVRRAGAQASPVRIAIALLRLAL